MKTKGLVSFFLFLIGKKPKEKIKEYKPTVSVLIPAFNEEKTIGDTIKSIKKQTYPIAEIIVIDDASTDKTAEIAQNLGAKVVKTPKNSGTKAKAQNFGLQFVNGEVVVTVDADTILAPSAIEKILPALSDGKTISACGFVLPQQRKTFWERARTVQYLYFIGLNKKAQEHWEVPLVSSGCFSAFNAKLLKEIGGFPEGTIVEDMVLTWRAHLAKKKVKLVPDAVCYPKDPENWKQYKSQMLRWNRGFLQSISYFGFSLFKNPRLAFFVFWYLLSGIINPFLWIYFVWYGIQALRFNNSISTFLFFLLFFGLIFEGLIVFVVTLVNARKFSITKEAIVNYPFYWLISPIDAYLWLVSLFKEWVLRQKLAVWEKGH